LDAEIESALESLLLDERAKASEIEACICRVQEAEEMAEETLNFLQRSSVGSLEGPRSGLGLREKARFVRLYPEIVKECDQQMAMIKELMEGAEIEGLRLEEQKCNF
jgi:hypothetical protein